MRVVHLNLALATWLLLSTFALGHTPTSALLTVAAAVLVAASTIASLGRPAIRYAIALVAMALAVLALLLPGVSGYARLSNALVAALLFALSLVSPRHGPAHADDHAGDHGSHLPGMP